MRRDFDLAIRAGGARLNPNLDASRLLLQRHALYVARRRYSGDFPNGRRRPDLAPLPFLVVDRPDANASLVLHRGAETAQVAISGRVTANNPHMLLRLAVEGAGIVTASEAMASRSVRTGALKRILSEWGLAPVAFTSSHPGRPCLPGCGCLSIISSRS